MQGFADVAADVLATGHGHDRAVARARYLETSGLPFSQQLELIAPGDARNAAAFDEFERRKRAVCEARPIDRATLDGLRALRAMGLRLIVSSNRGQELVDEFARREPIAFDLALGFDATRGRAKGRPHVEHVCGAFALVPAELVFCGDSLNDAVLAAGCGVRFIGRLGTFAVADFRARDPDAIVVSGIAELPALLRARAWIAA